MEGLHTMINRRDSYITLEDVISDLGNTSYKEEMMKQSDLFYIVYFWKIMVNDPKVHLEEDSKFREMHLKHPVIRNLGYKYLRIDRSKYLYP